MTNRKLLLQKLTSKNNNVWYLYTNFCQIYRYPTEIAGALFYNLFDCLFDGEPSLDVKDELANEVIKILNDSVACDSSTMSSLLLILLKLCKTYKNIDLKAVERVGIKSLNFSKAILLLEELIICKENHIEGDRVRGVAHYSGLDKNKEWIWLKRLHEASGKWLMKCNFFRFYWFSKLDAWRVLVAW